MKRVMVVLPELETGGGQRIALEIVRNIKREDVVIQVVSLYPRRGEILETLADESGIDVRYLSKTKGFCPAVFFQIYRVIREFRPDVIHAHLRVMPYLLAPMCLCHVPRRYYTVHNLADRDASGVKRLILRFAFRFCKVLPVAISPLCQRSICQVYGLPMEKVALVEQGIDVKRFVRPEKYDQLPDDEIRILAVGRLSEQKNYELMLDVFREVHSLHPNTSLLILGEGEKRELLQQRIEQLGISDSVSMPGITDKVNEAMWNSHIYLMSSHYEGLPLVVLEAMSAGMPIVSTRAGGVVDVVLDGENGFLVECGDAQGLARGLSRLIEDRALRERFSACSEQLAQRYSIENHAQKYLELYLK